MPGTKGFHGVPGGRCMYVWGEMGGRCLIYFVSVPRLGKGDMGRSLGRRFLVHVGWEG